MTTPSPFFTAENIAAIRQYLEQQTQPRDANMHGIALALVWEVERLLADLSRAEQQRDSALADVERLRRRTHELQETHDKKYAALLRERGDARVELEAYKETERWARECIAQMTGEDRCCGMSAATAVAVGGILKERDSLWAVVRAACNHFHALWRDGALSDADHWHVVEMEAALKGEGNGSI